MLFMISRHFPTLKKIENPLGVLPESENLSKRNKAFSSRVNTSEFSPEKCGLVSSRAFSFFRHGK